MSNIKDFVKLRERVLPSGRISLYLDIYRWGEREREALKLYIEQGKDRETREKNKQTRMLAEAIRAKRMVEVLNNEYGFRGHRDGILFFPFADKVAGERRHKTIAAAVKYMRQYEKREHITVAEITPQWCEGFKRFLDAAPSERGRRLSENSKRLYFSNLRVIMHQAIAEDVVRDDPTKGLINFRGTESERQCLTVEELQRLTATPCTHDVVRRAFLFACLTGLRRSDVDALRWRDIQRRGEFARIVFRQQKTGGLEYLDITPQAESLLGEPRSSDEPIFKGLPYPYYANDIIRRWVLRAGIDKDITFHCARHTFAVMMIDIGTDIYVVSRLLGHREVATTQIYTKVLDKNKQKAVSNIPNIFGEKWP